MKIAILGPYPWNGRTNETHGGVQAVVVNMIKGLSRFSNLDIHVLTCAFNTDKNLDLSSGNINIHVLPTQKRFGNITFFKNARKRICRKIKEIGPDLIHSHMLDYYTLAALDSGYKKSVVSTHGLSDINYLTYHSFIDKIRQYLYDIIYTRCAERAEYVIVNNPHAKKRLAKFKKMKVFELNNPISDPYFYLQNDSEKEQRLLFVGSVCETKGLMCLLYSMNILKGSFRDIKLIIAGSVTDNRFYYKLLRFINSNGLDSIAKFLGHLNEEDLIEEYRKASIFIFPSHYDIAPMALLQAMAAGKAIVATNVGGIPYIIEDGVNGFLVEKGDFYALTDRISLFIIDHTLRRRFGFNARDKVSEDYRISTVTDKLYKIYTEVL